MNKTMSGSMNNTSNISANAAAKNGSKAPMLWVIAVCIAPMIAAYAVYYGMDWQPNTETTNYGELLTGQAELPTMPSATTLDGKPFTMKQVFKKWTFITVDSGECNESCAKRLFTHRQLKAITGRERERVARLWFVTDDAVIKPELLTAHPDLIVVRVKPQELQGLQASSGQTLAQHTWMIDPLGRPMMRYGAAPDPDKMKKDVSKLLYASKNWQQ
jgi:hypothetical protein